MIKYDYFTGNTLFAIAERSAYRATFKAFDFSASPAILAICNDFSGYSATHNPENIAEYDGTFVPDLISTAYIAIKDEYKTLLEWSTATGYTYGIDALRRHLFKIGMQATHLELKTLFPQKTLSKGVRTAIKTVSLDDTDEDGNRLFDIADEKDETVLKAFANAILDFLMKESPRAYIAYTYTIIKGYSEKSVAEKFPKMFSSVGAVKMVKQRANEKIRAKFGQYYE